MIVLVAAVVVGVTGVLAGLGLLPAGHRRTARRGIAAPRELSQSRCRDTTVLVRDRDGGFDSRTDKWPSARSRATRT